MIEVYQSAWQDIAPRPVWIAPVNRPIQKVFVVVLRADGLDDFEVPVNSIMMRLRDSNGSYIRAVVPDPTQYTSQILTRSDGRMHIFGGYIDESGVRTLEEIVYANVQNIYFHKGLGQNILTIAGTRYATHSNPRAVNLSGVSRVSKDEAGRFSVRAAMDIFVKPMDVATVNGEQFSIDLITCYVGAADSYMDIEGGPLG